jgi:hypothetical protein
MCVLRGLNKQCHNLQGNVFIRCSQCLSRPLELNISSGDSPAEFQLDSGQNPVKELWTRAECVWERVLSDMCGKRRSGDEGSVPMVR